MSGSSINLSGSWTTFWAKVSGATGMSDVLMYLGWIGMLVVVGGIFTYLWKKRRSQGQGVSGMGQIGWAMLVGAILAAPSVLIPVLLWFVDLVANLAIGIFSH